MNIDLKVLLINDFFKVYLISPVLLFLSTIWVLYTINTAASTNITTNIANNDPNQQTYKQNATITSFINDTTSLIFATGTTITTSTITITTTAATNINIPSNEIKSVIYDTLDEKINEINKVTIKQSIFPMINSNINEWINAYNIMENYEVNVLTTASNKISAFLYNKSKLINDTVEELLNNGAIISGSGNTDDSDNANLTLLQFDYNIFNNTINDIISPYTSFSKLKPNFWNESINLHNISSKYLFNLNSSQNATFNRMINEFITSIKQEYNSTGNNNHTALSTVNKSKRDYKTTSTDSTKFDYEDDNKNVQNNNKKKKILSIVYTCIFISIFVMSIIASLIRNHYKYTNQNKLVHKKITNNIVPFFLEQYKNNKDDHQQNIRNFEFSLQNHLPQMIINYINEYNNVLFFNCTKFGTRLGTSDIEDKAYDKSDSVNKACNLFNIFNNGKWLYYLFFIILIEKYLTLSLYPNEYSIFSDIKEVDKSSTLSKRSLVENTKEIYETTIGSTKNETFLNRLGSICSGINDFQEEINKNLQDSMRYNLINDQGNSNYSGSILEYINDIEHIYNEKYSDSVLLFNELNGTNIFLEEQNKATQGYYNYVFELINLEFNEKIMAKIINSTVADEAFSAIITKRDKNNILSMEENKEDNVPTDKVKNIIMNCFNYTLLGLLGIIIIHHIVHAINFQY
ncbi:pheromone-regulated protein PRM2 SCDLUD_000380 [Saccharomycodes ludwigii]|uniref:pheromone-regulated protein PRM2 n=1 Tax=Saccharomycodes ludwigii TaxID=36035 RepID=UPI001E81C533|nr:hypothetical protein SCDLUD_000380 [Saccharomycodes ludwigii]KAH3902789.1 hypothetical protein SCDLUD_000380 [Saccharomycodes ludwigii]